MRYRINKQYKELTKSIEELYLQFNERKLNLRPILYSTPNFVIEDLNNYKRKLNELFNQFTEVAIEKYAYLKNLYAEWEEDNSNIKSFSEYAELRLRLLKQQIEGRNKNIIDGATAVAVTTSATLAASTILLLLNKTRPYEISTVINLALTSGALITGGVAKVLNNNLGEFSYFQTCDLVKKFNKEIDEFVEISYGFLEDVSKDLENGITIENLQAQIELLNEEIKNKKMELKSIYPKLTVREQYKENESIIKTLKKQIEHLINSLNYTKNKLKYIQKLKLNNNFDASVSQIKKQNKQQSMQNICTQTSN